MPDAALKKQALVLLLATAATLLLAGCETTAQKSARLEKANKGKLQAEKGVSVTKSDPKIKVGTPVIIEDEFGMAAVAEIKNTGRQAVVKPPIELVVEDGNGKEVFRNDTPGLDPALVSVAALPAGGEGFFVYDQLAIETDVAKAKAKVKVGAGKRTSKTARLPEFLIDKTEFERDQDGNTITGRVTNKSNVDQKRLVLYGVGKRDGKIVAAGTAQIERLAAGKAANFQMFFVGDPRGLRIETFVPPTTLK